YSRHRGRGGGPGLARGGEGDAGRPRLPQRCGVAGREIDSVDLVELVPGQRVVTMGMQLRAHQRDRPLTAAVDEGERTALRRRTPRRLNVDPALAKLRGGPAPDRVVAERHEETGPAGECRQLGHGDAAAAACLHPRSRRADDLAWERYAVHAGELDHLDMTDDRDPEISSARWLAHERFLTLLG